jgi:tryptophan-rich sensory protein
MVACSEKLFDDESDLLNVQVGVLVGLVALTMGFQFSANWAGWYRWHDWYDNVVQAVPNRKEWGWIFAPAWTLIYLAQAALRIVSLLNVCEGDASVALIVLFYIDTVLNNAWTIFFMSGWTRACGGERGACCFSESARARTGLAVIVANWLVSVALLCIVAALGDAASIVLAALPVVWIGIATVFNLQTAANEATLPVREKGYDCVSVE